MHALRRYKLRQLIATRFGDSRERFLTASGLSKGRLSQLLDENEPFGDVAARNLEERLQLDPGFFDSMNAETVQWAMQFDSLPAHLRQRWSEIVRMLGDGNTLPAQE